jgi:hypothetical protein
MADINLGVGGANSAVAGGYDIANSLKFEEDNLELLYKTFSGEGTGAGRTFTISTWCKRTELDGIDIVFGFGRDSLDYGDGGFRLNSNQLQLVSFAQSGGTHSYNIRSTQVFRDTSAWYHFMAAVDTTQGTASNRVRLYVNGTEITDFTTSDYPAQNFQWKVGRAEEHMIGNRPDASGTEGAGFSTQNFSGYMAEFHFVDGQQLDPTDFGEFDTDTGIWKPKAYTGSYGTNGFYLDFESSGSLGTDSSGNGNNFTLSNITSADQATDTPTNNFCTLNILDQEFDGTNIITDGATNVRIAGSGSGALRGTYAVSQGKWYWEMKITPINTSSFYGVWGIYTADKSLTGYPGSTTGSWGIYGGNGNAYYNGSSTTFYTDSIASGDIFSYAFNADDGQLFVYKNGSIIGANSGDLIATSGTSFPADFTYYSPTFADGTNSPEPSGLLSRFEVNFGGFTNFSIASGNTDENGYGNFEYAPPSGYYALCSKNLAEFG